MFKSFLKKASFIAFINHLYFFRLSFIPLNDPYQKLFAFKVLLKYVSIKHFSKKSSKLKED